MLPDTGLDRKRSSPVMPMSHLPPDSESYERRTFAFRRLTGDEPPVELTDDDPEALEHAGLDWEIIEMRFQAYLTHREVEELFASGDLPSLGG